MPAFYAHDAFGILVYQSLPAPLKEAFGGFEDTFSLGFQGPDILFYHKPFKSVSKNPVRGKGMDMHLSSAKPFFIDCAKKISAQEVEDVRRTPLAAYVAGFICHFSLDNACHGHVYQLEDTGVSHGLIESEFDKYMKRRQGQKVHKNAASYINDKKGTSLAVATALDVSQKSVKKSMKTIKRVNGLFSNRSKLFHKFAHLLLKIVKAEKFGDMFLHFKDDTNCSQLNPVLEEKLLAAVQPTANRITAYFENLEKIAQNGEIDCQFDRDYTGDKIV